MAVKAKSKAITAPKRKTKRVAPKIRRGAKLAEPNWEGAVEWSGEEFHSFRRRAIDFYYQEFKPADLIPYLWEWMKNNEYTARDIKAAKAAPNHSVPSVACSIARCLTNGMPNVHPAWNTYWESLAGTSGTPGDASDYVREAIAKLISIGEPQISAKEAEEKRQAKMSKQVYKPTIQDRLDEKVDEILGELEGRYDAVILNDKKAAPDAYNLFKVEKLPQARIGQVVEFATLRKQELTQELAAVKAGDEQAKEGYAHMKPADWKRHIAWWDVLLQECDAFAQLKKTTRKARVRKSPSKDKLVAKLKFKKEDTDLKLVSVNPTDIVGASELWVYNTKTRKLGKYVALNVDPKGLDRSGTGLTIKGTTIVGFKEDESVQKTLRKPAEQLSTFNKSGKIQLRKFMEGIRTTETKLNGRINADTMLLKVQ